MVGLQDAFKGQETGCQGKPVPVSEGPGLWCSETAIGWEAADALRRGVALFELRFSTSLWWPAAGGLAVGETIKKLMGLPTCIYQDEARKTEPARSNLIEGI